MNSIWSLHASARLVSFIFLMISLAFLLFSIVFVSVSRRHKIVIFYVASIFVSVFLMVITRTPILLNLNQTFCDYLSLFNLVPTCLALVVLFKNKNYLLIGDMAYFIINITLLSFIPYYGYIVSYLYAYLILRAIMIFRKSFNDSKMYPGQMSIKYSFDKLDEGICFANTFKQITYMNKSFRDCLNTLKISNYEKIDKIYKELLNKADRVISNNEFIINIEDKSYCFNLNKNGNQLTCLDVSYEESLLKEMEANKNALFKLNLTLNERLKEAGIIQEEKELLSFKGYIHDSLAQKLSIIHMFLLNDDSTDLTKIKEMINELDIDLELKQKDDLSTLRRLLEDIGVKLTIQGALPEDKEIKSLFIKTIKEGVTNAIRHGNAKTINVNIQSEMLTITNDGLIPNSIRYGNGLSGIDIEAKQYQFNTSINIDKCFKLIISRE